MTNEIIYKQMKVYEAECEAKGKKVRNQAYEGWNFVLGIEASPQRYASMERQGLIRCVYKIDGRKYYNVI